MKPLYSRFFRVTPLFSFLLFLISNTYGQCPDGQPAGQTAFDTTIATPAGITTMQLNFPKFDPSSGMVTCVRLCITITGVVDTMSIENASASPQTADVFYFRNDQITGPGLSTPLSNSISKHYGQYNLAADDLVPGSGLDFRSVSKDTILNSQLVCRTISDSATIAQFYGIDSVTYTYDIVATVSPVSSGNYNFSVGTSAFVNFRFEYCTCPPTVLPSNINQFNVTKLTADKAELKWSGFDDPYANYSYEAEVSRDGHNFSKIGSFQKNTDNSDPYRLVYRAVNGEKGIHFFRIKQVYSTGQSKYSNIKQVTLENSDFPKFTLYPNPSDGIVGIKFDNILNGHFNIFIYNTQGQVMVKKDIAEMETSYIEVATLQRGVYWVRLTDVKSQLSSVNQLLIK